MSLVLARSHFFQQLISSAKFQAILPYMKYLQRIKFILCLAVINNNEFSNNFCLLLYDI